MELKFNVNKNELFLRILEDSVNNIIIFTSSDIYSNSEKNQILSVDKDDVDVPEDFEQIKTLDLILSPGVMDEVLAKENFKSIELLNKTISIKECVYTLKQTEGFKKDTEYILMFDLMKGTALLSLK